MKFLTINNRKNFLIGEVPVINPYSRRYISWWREQRKRIIEGFWSIDDADVTVDISEENPQFPATSNNWRYIPPVAYFYVNFGTIMANKKGATSGAKIPIRPSLDDIEWEFHYSWLEARGFSGFENDESVSCNRMLEDEDLTDKDLVDHCRDANGEIVEILYNNFFKKNKIRKTYVPARVYLRRLHDKNLGRPVYGNTPKNMMILGTRDGGKSFLGGSIISHEMLTDGIRYYEKNMKVIPKAEIVVGASISDKSRDIINKAKLTMDNLPGTWKKGSEDQKPPPIYKHTKGSLEPNKEWKSNYDKYFGGEKIQAGSGSLIKHKVFTSENPEAAAGGRPGTIIVDEVGLMGNVISVHGGNVAAQNDSGFKFGSSLYLGTAGNVEKIIESEILFNDPLGFDMLEFDNIWEPEVEHKICWFIPATHMARKFKDENGNTDIEKAEKHFQKRREKMSKATSRKALDTEMMNYPLIPSEMFVNADDNDFPIKDLKHQYSKLMGNHKLLDESYKVEFVLKDDGTIDVKNVKNKPIREYPLRDGGPEIMAGCPEIFVMPQRDEYGNVPSGIFIAGYDPIDDDDNSDITRSLQSFWIMNRFTGELVFEYTGRTKYATDFYEQCRRALLYYNAVCNYENNKKGFYPHMYNKTSLHLLVPTPEILLQKDVQKSVGAGNKSLGTNVNTDVKSLGIELIRFWLDEPSYSNEDITNLQTIKSPALLRELISYNEKGNFDRISALIVLLILREEKRRIVKKVKRRIKRAADDDFFNRMYGHNNSGY